jgi:hypothetical protein
VRGKVASRKEVVAPALRVFDSRRLHFPQYLQVFASTASPKYTRVRIAGYFIARSARLLAASMKSRSGPDRCARLGK